MPATLTVIALIVLALVWAYWPMIAFRRRARSTFAEWDDTIERLRER